MSERQEKKQRQIQRKFLTTLVSNFTLWDRVIFLFTGNYYKPLQRTYSRIKPREE